MSAVVSSTGYRGAGAVLRPVLALQAALLVSVVSNLGRIPVFSTGDATNAPLLVNDIAVAIVIAAGLMVAARNRSLRMDDVAITAALFALVGGLSAVAAVPKYGLSGFELAVSLAYLARWLFYFALYVVIINTVSRRDVEGVWKALEWMLLAFALFGIVQSLFLPGFAQMVYPDSRVRFDWDEQGHRLVSTVLEPNIAAAMILLGLLVHLGRLSTGANVAGWKPLVLFTALVMTLSRSGALALLVGGLVILAARGLSKRVMQFGAALLVLLAVSLPRLIPFMQQYDKLSFGGSAAGRLVNLAQVLTAFLDSPWIGVGFNTFGFYMERQGVDRMGLPFQSSDGGLLFAAAMTGVIGVGIYCMMLFAVFRRCRAVWRSPHFTPDERGLCLGVAAGIAALCAHSLFVNSLFSTAVLLPLWALWGLTFAIRTNAGAEPIPTTGSIPCAVVLTGA